MHIPARPSSGLFSFPYTIRRQCTKEAAAAAHDRRERHTQQLIPITTDPTELPYTSAIHSKTKVNYKPHFSPLAAYEVRLDSMQPTWYVIFYRRGFRSINKIFMGFPFNECSCKCIYAYSLPISHTHAFVLISLMGHGAWCGGHWWCPVHSALSYTVFIDFYLTYNDSSALLLIHLCLPRPRPSFAIYYSAALFIYLLLGKDKNWLIVCECAMQRCVFNK